MKEKEHDFVVVKQGMRDVNGIQNRCCESLCGRINDQRRGSVSGDRGSLEKPNQ
jgi:hypothetical protein